MVPRRPMHTHDCRGADYVTALNPRLLFTLKLMEASQQKRLAVTDFYCQTGVCECV